MSDNDLRVPLENLRWVCDPEMLDFSTTNDLPELEGTIGQERALRSIDFSLGMTEGGFNLYISGEAGTGRTSSIMNLLKKRAREEPAPSDWCYVYNFKSPDNPTALALSAGMGNELEKDMRELLAGVRADIPKALESKEYENNKTTIVQEQQERNNTMFSALEQEAQLKGFALQRTVSGLVMVPQKDERNLTQEEYDALAPDEQEKIDAIGNALKEKLSDLINQIRENEKEVKEALARLDRNLGLSAVGHHIEPLKTKYAEFPHAITYLENVQEDILLNLEDFKGVQQQPPFPGSNSRYRHLPSNAIRLTSLWTTASSAARRWCSRPTPPTTTSSAESIT